MNRLKSWLKVAALTLAYLCAGVIQIEMVHAQNTDTYFYTPGGGGVNGSLGMCLNQQNKAVPCSGAGVTPSPVSITPYPVNPTTAVAAAPVTASATGTTGAVTATLPATAGKTTYLCSVQIGEAGTGSATATATGTISGTLNYVVSAPANFTVSYNPCVPASAVNQSIAIATAANASATAVAVTATGYQY